MGILCLSVNATEAHSDQVLNDLVNASRSIVQDLDNAYKLTGGLAYAGYNGRTIGIGAADVALITPDQVAAYNNAVAAMADADYYHAREFFEDQAAESYENMETAIDSFVEATVELVQTVEVAELAVETQESGTLEDKQDLSTFVEENQVSLVIDQEDVDNFNNSLIEVEETASTAAMWTAASQNDELVAYSNEQAEEWGVSFTEVNNIYTDEYVAYFDWYEDQNWSGAEYIWFTTDYLGQGISINDLLSAGEESGIYQEGPTAAYRCFVLGDCES